MNIIAFLCAFALAAQAKPVVMSNPACIPVPEIEKNNYDWRARHERICREAPKMNPEIVLVGDSITHFWTGLNSIGGDDAAPLFKELFKGYRVLDAGFGYDRTQNVLWRIDHGEFDAIDPKLVVLMIGTNNLGDGTPRGVHKRVYTPEETAEGIRVVVDRLRAKLPRAKLLVMGVLARGEKPDHYCRGAVRWTNALLASRLEGLSNVTFLDVSERFLGEAGWMRGWYSWDFIHLTDEGYRIWFDELDPYIRESVGVRRADFEKIPYATDGAADLKVGLWCWPMVMDYDRDGIDDLVVVCPGDPSHGTYFFRNPGGKFPVFEKGVRVTSAAPWNVTVQKLGGETVVVQPGRIFRDFPREGFTKGEQVSSPDALFWFRKGLSVRNSCWRFVDFDGDGHDDDVMIGLDDWSGYGWADSYDAEGRWKNEPLKGRVFVSRKGAEPVELTLVDGSPLRTYGNAMPMFEDFDGDGDRDLICGSFRDELTYFENVGTATEPKFARGVPLRGIDGAEIRGELCMIVPTAADWDRDGDIDLICGEEDGRVSFIENLGRGADGKPRFAPPRFFQQERDKVGVGALATPFAIDFDGDGDIDILCGDSAGFVSFVENVAGKGASPRYLPPVRLTAAGEVIRILAGENGSIQGPAEAKWGYTVLTAADWDGDGFLDIMVNSIFGDIVWYRNPGRVGSRDFEAARPVEVEWGAKGQPALKWGWRKPKGKALLTQWRTTPVMIDWNADGLMDLVMLDHEGYLALFRRFRDDTGALRLAAPERVFFWDDGTPMQLATGKAGGSGRRKLCFVDWDGDGLKDLVLNGINVNIHRQIRSDGARWIFAKVGSAPAVRKLAGHTTAPTAADFNADGRDDLLVGAEDGFLYLLSAQP